MTDGDHPRPRVTANESGEWTILLEDGSVRGWIGSTETVKLEDNR